MCIREVLRGYRDTVRCSEAFGLAMLMGRCSGLGMVLGMGLKGLQAYHRCWPTSIQFSPG